MCPTDAISEKATVPISSCEQIFSKCLPMQIIKGILILKSYMFYLKPNTINLITQYNPNTNPHNPPYTKKNTYSPMKQHKAVWQAAIHPIRNWSVISLVPLAESSRHTQLGCFHVWHLGWSGASQSHSPRSRCHSQRRRPVTGAKRTRKFIWNTVWL